jgi:uncharacterized protein (TIGR00375 family)
MRFIADLHIHSYYSRATSKKLDLEHLYQWGQLKGLQVIATGDITHPKWLAEMREKLIPSAPGLYQLDPSLTNAVESQVPLACRDQVHFILSGEISCIYKKGDRVRKSHHVVFFSTLEAVAEFQKRLDRIGNIHSDGRPILGLDARNLLELVLETDPDGILIPAHIWTPWFSVLGSKSGFDSIQDCFDDLTPHIFALETGLSSDPPMNWRCSQLDDYVLVSNSDAHSPEKLAREANIFDTGLSYAALFEALKQPHTGSFWGTVEFFPEEGKYHLDGHRKCGYRAHPRETLAHNGICPVCGKAVVKGVSYRVEELADRPEGFKPDNAKPFLSLIPLSEVLSQVLKVGPKSKKVQSQYGAMLQTLGSEMSILMNTPLESIERATSPVVAEAIRRMREGEVEPEGGYDGEYGVIKIFKGDEQTEILNPGKLFSYEPRETPVCESKPPDATTSVAKQPAPDESATTKHVADASTPTSFGLNNVQRQAVEHRGSPLIIQAGPGTGKTRTLTHRLAHLIKTLQALPDHVLAVTFTNKAADEMVERLVKLVGRRAAGKMNVHTFHALGAKLLRTVSHFDGRTSEFVLVDPEQFEPVQQQLAENRDKRRVSRLIRDISRVKSQLYGPQSLPPEGLPGLADDFIEGYRAYESIMREYNAVDFDDLIYWPVLLMRRDPEQRRQWLNRYSVIAVDEFQDINTAQYELFKLFALAAEDVCAIGDPDQAIYGFRGADRRFFYQFMQDFDALKIDLTQNYRSIQPILSASVQMLNRDATGSSLWSELDSDVKCEIHEASTDRAEAELIVHQIEQWMGGTSHFSIDSSRVGSPDADRGYSFSDFAILLRTRRLAGPLVEALTRSGIPFELFENKAFDQEAGVGMILDALRWSVDSDPQMIRYPHLMNHLNIDTPESMADFPAAVSESLAALSALAPDMSVQDRLHACCDIISPPLPDERMRGLIDLAKSFRSRLDEYLDALMLHRDIDELDETVDRVRVLTLHASKGLEFPVVFIAGLEDDIMPLQWGGVVSDEDEERRLLYVGMTRAQHRLVLSWARHRSLQDNRTKSPSRFLSDIQKEWLDRLSMRPHKGGKQMDLF